MAPLPKRITRRKVLEALDVLGIPHTDVRTVELGLYEVTVREAMKPETQAERGKGTVHVERVTVIPTSVMRGDPKPATGSNTTITMTNSVGNIAVPRGADA